MARRVAVDEALLDEFIVQAIGSKALKTTVLACMPIGITRVRPCDPIRGTESRATRMSPCCSTSSALPTSTMLAEPFDAFARPARS